MWWNFRKYINFFNILLFFMKFFLNIYLLAKQWNFTTRVVRGVHEVAEFSKNWNFFFVTALYVSLLNSTRRVFSCSMRHSEWRPPNSLVLPQCLPDSRSCPFIFFNANVWFHRLLSSNKFFYDNFFWNSAHKTIYPNSTISLYASMLLALPS